MTRLSDLPGALRSRFGGLESVAPETGVKHASVAIVLRPRPGAGEDPPARSTELLVIKRARHEGDPWSGHMALPGGRAQDEDRDLVDTAVRETLEETALDLARGGEALGRVETVRPVGRGLPPVTIWPIVFRVGYEAMADVASPREVEQVHWFGTDELMAPENRSTYRVRREDADFRFPCIRIQEQVIWGITYRILEDFFSTVG